MGGEEEEAVVSKVREFQICGICCMLFRGVVLFRGFGFRGQDPQIPRPKPDRKASNSRHRPWSPKLYTLLSPEPTACRFSYPSDST